MQSGLRWEQSRPKRAKHMFSHPETVCCCWSHTFLWPFWQGAICLFKWPKGQKSEKHLGDASSLNTTSWWIFSQNSQPPTILHLALKSPQRHVFYDCKYSCFQAWYGQFFIIVGTKKGNSFCLIKYQGQVFGRPLSKVVVLTVLKLEFTVFSSWMMMKT